jgi:hypothetical protein
VLGSLFYKPRAVIAFANEVKLKTAVTTFYGFDLLSPYSVFILLDSKFQLPRWHIALNRGHCCYAI